MLTNLRQQLTQHVPQQTHFLIGLSGGVDSVVLLHLFAQLRKTYNLTLRSIHIHHGLSPYADNWAAFCQKLCQQLNIPLLVKKVQVTGKEGLEANARKARYQAIQTVAFPNEIFTTAHHLDDQVETFFLALKRGSGVKGLSAMQAVGLWQNLTIFRPLLTISKADILDYAKKSHLNWIEDESNENIAFDRNFLRQIALPIFNQRWHHFNQMVARASQHCSEQQQLLTELLADELNSRINITQKSLDINGFSRFSPLKQQQLIRLWLEQFQLQMPSQLQLDQILHSLINAEADKNPQLTLGTKVIRRYQHHLFITEQFKPTQPFQEHLSVGKTLILPDNIGSIERTESQLIYKISEQSYRFQIPNALGNAQLTVKLHYLGKVKCYNHIQREDMKKIWQKNRVPVWERQRTPLIFFEDELVMILHASYYIEKQAIKTEKTKQ